MVLLAHYTLVGQSCCTRSMLLWILMCLESGHYVVRWLLDDLHRPNHVFRYVYNLENAGPQTPHKVELSQNNLLVLTV
jgi:hypothetical protein